MTTERLFRRPKNTTEILRSIMAGASTVDDIADELDCSQKTVWNKTHDGVVLGLIERNDGEVSVSDDARRIVQLDDDSPYRERFVNLDGVPEVLDHIKQEALSVEQVGRIVSFESGSNAAAEDTFKKYGRVYGEWIDHLGLGTFDEGVVAEDEKMISADVPPLKNPRGANCPRVSPEKALNLLPRISQAESREDLKSQVDMSAKTLEKTLTTCYALGIAESTSFGPKLTDRGAKLQQASVGNRKAIVAEELLKIPLVKAYCETAPEGSFVNADVMQQVSDEHLKGWSEQTVQTRAKRLYPWLLYAELAEKTSQGQLRLNNDHGKAALS